MPSQMSSKKEAENSTKRSNKNRREGCAEGGKDSEDVAAARERGHLKPFRGKEQLPRQVSGSKTGSESFCFLNHQKSVVI